MTDRGKGARSKRAESPPPPKWRMTFLMCEKCGSTWMFRHIYDSDLRQTQDEFGHTLCRKCRRKEEVRHTPSPPPASVQMTIDEVFKTKK